MMPNSVQNVLFGAQQVTESCTQRAILGLNRLFLTISTNTELCTQEQAKRKENTKTAISSGNTG